MTLAASETDTSAAPVRARHQARRATTIVTPTRLALLGVLVLGAALRLIFAGSGTASMDADEAVTGIMARRILSGQEFYTYFTRQTYNGSFEQYLQALGYAVTRLPETPFTLRLTQVTLTLAVMLSIYFLGRIAFTSRWTAVLASAVYAVGPLFNVLLGTKSYGGYDTTQLACVLAVIAALRVTGFEPGRVRGERPRRWLAWWALFGLCAGLIVWTGLTGLEILFAAIVWVLPAFFRSIRAIGATALGAIVGVSPVLWWMSRHGWAIPGVGGPQPPTTVSKRFDILFHQVGREYLGMSLTNNSEAWGPLPTHLLFAGIGIAAVIALVLRWRGILAALTLRAAHRQPIDLVMLAIPSAIVVYLSVSHTWYAGQPRYLFMLYPITAVTTAGAIGWLATRRIPMLRQVVVALTVIGLALTSGNVVRETRILADPGTLTTNAEFQRADAYLESHGIRAAYAQYWMAVPADYWADPSKLSVASWAGRGGNGGKSGVARAMVDQTSSFAYMTGNRSAQSTDSFLVPLLAAHHITYTAVHFGSITIYTNLSQQIRPWDLGV